MRIFKCPSCGAPVFFTNLVCGCGSPLVFRPAEQAFSASGRLCSNREAISCNWAAEDGRATCASCVQSAVVPDLTAAENSSHWATVEVAKRWVLANFARWDWFGSRDQGLRPIFHLLAEKTGEGLASVSMGHEDGTITINVSEADLAVRHQRRKALGESFRTMVGHIRHELAHFMFVRFSAEPGFLDDFRALFGDERSDYAAALASYYENGARGGWPVNYISAYASSHPHEDWAESFAHLLHLTDMIDSLLASAVTGPGLPPVGYDAYLERDAQQLIAYGAHVGLALNHVNRSMGLSDIYPFVHTPKICEKMAFIHERLRRGPKACEGAFNGPRVEAPPLSIGGATNRC
jgi:hypothetical protein